MKYDKYDRQAIKQLSDQAGKLFEVIEREEKGIIIDVPGLCSSLENPTFVLFSCLAGDGETEELGQDLGVLFTTKLRLKVQHFTDLLKSAGFSGKLQVIIDDTEPVKFWNWKKDQSEVTLWCQMVMEEADIPADWEVRLWSSLESDFRQLPDWGSSSCHDSFCSSKSSEVVNSIVFHRLYQHIKEFPNKGLQLKKVSVRKATVDKLIQYQFQCLVLNAVCPRAILVQTETPWEVKDPLFHGPLGNSFTSIIHPFERRR